MQLYGVGITAFCARRDKLTRHIPTDLQGALDNESKEDERPNPRDYLHTVLIG